MLKAHHVISDDKGELSLSRLGLILTILIAVATIAIDITLTVGHATARIPNSVYALETSMFMSFVSWVTGPRMASFFAPHITSAAATVANAVRDALPGQKDG